MAKLSVNQILSKAKSHEKKGEILDAQKLYKIVLDLFPNNKRALVGLSNSSRQQQTISNQKPPEKIMGQLVNLYKQGKFLSVVENAQKLVQQYPKAFSILNILGAANMGLGRFDKASEAFLKVTELNPEYPDGYNNLGACLQEQGKLDKAIQAYNKALLIKPIYPEACYNIGVALQKQGNLVESIKTYKKVLSIKPNYVEAWNNMGNAFKDLGKYEDANIAYNKALLVNPNYAETYNNLGNLFQNQNNLEGAINFYNKALSIKPKYAEVFNNLGNILKEQGKLREAIISFNKALSIKPDYAEAFNNIGNVFENQDKLVEALDAYSKARSLRIDYTEAWLNGAEVLEKWNKLDQLDLWLKEAFEAFENVPSDIVYFQAKLLWRKKEKRKVSKLLSTIELDSIAEVRKKGFLNLKAKCFETSKDFSKAYDCFLQMNLLAKNSHDYLNCSHKKFFQNSKDQLAHLKLITLPDSSDNVLEEIGNSPVFLVGFPRSGTTLMDTILRSHSAIEVLEEKGTVAAAKAIIRRSGKKDYYNKEFNSDTLFEAKTAYYAEFNKHIKVTNTGNVYIDKLPLNLLEVPLIRQLFPKAKFILALRHPFDTILSCWMQDFELNAAMANMVDLDRIVELYCIAMETFKICKADYNLNIHTMKYEDLLEDLKGESSSLLKFLDLNWESQMADYHTTALKRGRINTPSYSQVSQPIYKDAKYRWINYKDYLGKYLDQIEPWIEEFGYDNY